MPKLAAVAAGTIISGIRNMAPPKMVAVAMVPAPISRLRAMCDSGAGISGGCYLTCGMAGPSDRIFASTYSMTLALRAFSRLASG